VTLLAKIRPRRHARGAGCREAQFDSEQNAWFVRMRALLSHGGSRRAGIVERCATGT